MTPGKIIFCLILLSSCTAHNVVDNDIQKVLAKATSRCKATTAEMEWMAVLIRKSESEPQFKGPIYAVPENGRTIFVHQPYILSCLACQLYNCQGDKIEISTVDMDEVLAGMNDSNLIYNPML